MMQLIRYAGHAAGLAGCAAVILTALLAQRAFVLRKPVDPRQITKLGIASIVAWSLRLLLYDVWPVMYGFMNYPRLMLPALTVYLTVLHAGFIVAGVLLLRSREKPVLAKAAQALQTALMLAVVLILLGNFLMQATGSFLDFGVLFSSYLLPLLFSAGLAVYPTIVWTQAMLRPRGK